MNSNTPQISIIIPALNEGGNVKALICHLRDSARGSDVEIIVADGGSSDDTVELAKNTGVIVVQSKVASRPVQMNLGASVARGRLLYFLHADAMPPKGFIDLLQEAVQNGADFGCFRFQFESGGPMMRFNAWCTRLPFMMCRGGDQSLFITRSLFDRLDGFDEKYVVMEDYDIIRRGSRLGTFKILAANVKVSARKYDKNSYLRVNLANFAIFCLYYTGVHPLKLKGLYARMIRHPKFTD